MDNLVPIPTNSVGPGNATVSYGLPTPVPVQKPVKQNHSNLVSLTGKGGKLSKGQASNVSKAPTVQKNRMKKTRFAPNGPLPLMSLSLPAPISSGFYPTAPMYPMFHTAFPKRRKRKKKTKIVPSEKQSPKVAAPPSTAKTDMVSSQQKPVMAGPSTSKAPRDATSPSMTKGNLDSVQQKPSVTWPTMSSAKPVSHATVAGGSATNPVTSPASFAPSASETKLVTSQAKNRLPKTKPSVSKTTHTKPDNKIEKNTYISDLVMVNQLHEAANRKGMVAHFIFLEPSDLEFRFHLNDNI
jgi:hypothetical protein